MEGVQFATVINYHQKQIVSRIGYLTVKTDCYRARWSHETPGVLYVRGFDHEADWVEWKIGGYLENADGALLPDMETLTADMEPIHAKKTNAVTFVAQCPQGGEYRFTLTFCKDYIAQTVEYVYEGELALKAAWFGTQEPTRGSFINADVIFRPSPSSHGNFYTSLRVRTLTGSICDNWFSPAPFCFPMRLKNGKWMSVSLAPNADQMQFIGLSTEPLVGEELTFRLDYASLPRFTGKCQLPDMVLRFGAESEFDALKDYAQGLVDMGKIAPVERNVADWWTGVMICGWNNQEGTDGCYQEKYEKHVAAYEKAGIPWDMLTIDDFWGKERGIWYADPETWPDLKGFIARQHAKNRRVLLWVCIVTKGLPEDELYRTDKCEMLDPCNPRYVKRLEEMLYYMLGDGEDCLQADGIKLDFTGGIPTGNVISCTRELHGMEYLHELFRVIHDAAKKAKPDCLLDFQVANPHFAALHDMTRLNDYFLLPEDALEIMGTRAKISNSVTFGTLVDTDHPESPEYFRDAYKFGNVSAYLRDWQLEENGEAIQALRETANRLAKSK